jgi:hypothetical protein
LKSCSIMAHFSFVFSMVENRQACRFNGGSVKSGPGI